MYTIKEYTKKFKLGTKKMFKEFFNKETNKKQRANMWTFSRIIVSFIIPILMMIGSITSSTLVLGLAFFTTGFGALTDYFDGKSARKYNSYSEYGKLLDQIADKVFAFMLGISLSIFNPMFLLSLFGESIIATTNILYKKKYENLNIQSTLIGKIKQWPLFTSLTFGFLSTLIPGLTIAVDSFIILTFLFQLTTMYSYIDQNNEQIKKVKSSQNYITKIDNNDEEKRKIKTIENSNTISNNICLSKKEQYEKLRDVLNDIIALKNNFNNDVNDLDNSKKAIQKIKK